MSVRQVMEKYVEALKSDVFAMYEKEYAGRIISALSKAYRQGKHEPALVQVTEYVVNNVHNFSVRDPKLHLELSTRSIFIHGSKSHVKFKYYGRWAKPIELGDLIFIISVVYNRRKYCEKITINQFKKDRSESKRISWGIRNKKQLYLLSRFPTFIGVKGLIPKKTYDLPNYSGCLGSYGLLYRPGDFAFVSATRLDSLMGGARTLKMGNLYNLERPWIYPILHPGYWDILGNCHLCYNVFGFVHEYLAMNIGEPIFMKRGVANPQARRFLDELMSVMRSKARMEKSKKTLSFIDAFRKFRYVEASEDNQSNNVDLGFEDGGIGIIHTTIDLGE